MLPKSENVDIYPNIYQFYTQLKEAWLSINLGKLNLIDFYI